MKMQEEKKRKQVMDVASLYSATHVPDFFFDNFSYLKELGLIDALGNSLEKKPTLSIDDDQAKWKADKLAKEAADKQVVCIPLCKYM